MTIRPYMCENHHRFTSENSNTKCPACETQNTYEVRMCVWCALLKPLTQLNDEGECYYCAEHALEGI